MGKKELESSRVALYTNIFVYLCLSSSGISTPLPPATMGSAIVQREGKKGEGEKWNPCTSESELEQVQGSKVWFR